MVQPASLPLLKRAVNAMHQDLRHAKVEYGRVKERFSRQNYVGLLRDDGKAAAMLAVAWETVHHRTLLWLHIERQVLAALGNDALNAWRICRQRYFDADSRSTDPAVIGECAAAGDAEALYMRAQQWEVEVWHTFKRLDVAVLLPLLSMALQPGNRRVAHLSAAALADQGSNIAGILIGTHTGQATAAHLRPPDETALLAREFDSAVAGVGYGLTKLRFVLQEKMMARLVDTHLGAIKARLWRPDGRLTQARADEVAAEGYGLSLNAN